MLYSDINFSRFLETNKITIIQKKSDKSVFYNTYNISLKCLCFPNFSQAWVDAITSWYNEVADMPDTLVESYGPSSNGKEVGHYAQVSKIE